MVLFWKSPQSYKKHSSHAVPLSRMRTRSSTNASTQPVVSSRRVFSDSDDDAEEEDEDEDYEDEDYEEEEEEEEEDDDDYDEEEEEEEEEEVEEEEEEEVEEEEEEEEDDDGEQDGAKSNPIKSTSSSLTRNAKSVMKKTQEKAVGNVKRKKKINAVSERKVADNAKSAKRKKSKSSSRKSSSPKASSRKASSDKASSHDSNISIILLSDPSTGRRRRHGGRKAINDKSHSSRSKALIEEFDLQSDVDTEENEDDDVSCTSSSSSEEEEDDSASDGSEAEEWICDDDSTFVDDEEEEDEDDEEAEEDEDDEDDEENLSFIVSDNADEEEEEEEEEEEQELEDRSKRRMNLLFAAMEEEWKDAMSLPAPSSTSSSSGPSSGPSPSSSSPSSSSPSSSSLSEGREGEEEAVGRKRKRRRLSTDSASSSSSMKPATWFNPDVFTSELTTYLRKPPTPSSQETTQPPPCTAGLAQDKTAALWEELEQSRKTLSMMEDMRKQFPFVRFLPSCVAMMQENIARLHDRWTRRQKRLKLKMVRIMNGILTRDRSLDDVQHFYRMDVAKQRRLIKELREVCNEDAATGAAAGAAVPLRIRILESTSIPRELKNIALRKIGTLAEHAELGMGGALSEEQMKVKQWVDGFVSIPFGVYRHLPVTMGDGIDACHGFLARAKQTLDDTVFGMDDAKMQVMQLFGQLLSNPQAVGSSVAIHGPPGTGKTTLVKHGISAMLNRPFVFIPLGGAQDAVFLEGGANMYIGSSWGKIAQSLMDAKCMNPVIYFDELDKLSDTPRGEEIANLLIHLTDTTQNTKFRDRFFAEFALDVSKVTFFFSYNDESKVNPILRDRMYRIHTKGYSVKDKIAIAATHLLPAIRREVAFAAEDVVFSDDVVAHLVEHCCEKEEGVRNLKRALEVIHHKLNLFRLMKPGANLFPKEMPLQVTFPFTVTKAVAEQLVHRTARMDAFASMYSMYV